MNELVYKDTDYGHIFETDDQLVKYLRELTLDDEYNDCTDEFLIAEYINVAKNDLILNNNYQYLKR